MSLNIFHWEDIKYPYHQFDLQQRSLTFKQQHSKDLTFFDEFKAFSKTIFEILMIFIDPESTSQLDYFGCCE